MQQIAGLRSCAKGYHRRISRVKRMYRPHLGLGALSSIQPRGFLGEFVLVKFHADALAAKGDAFALQPQFLLEA